MGYLRHQREWRDKVAREADCRVLQVESDAIVPVAVVSEKAEYAARTIRPGVAEGAVDGAVYAAGWISDTLVRIAPSGEFEVLLTSAFPAGTALDFRLDLTGDGANVDAKDKLEVLAAVGELSGDLREELGDDSLDREKLRISETFTAKSLEAAQAYSHAMALVDEEDPDLLADYAEALALAHGNTMAGAPAKLLERALAIDPEHAKSLWYGGLAAYEVEDYAVAVERWQKLMVQLPADSDNARQLQQHWPGTVFLGEEMAADEQARLLAAGQPVWCLDPLDGTANFAAGIPFFAVSLALIVAGEVVAGLVFDPARNECFSALRGQGVTMRHSILFWAMMLRSPVTAISRPMMMAEASARITSGYRCTIRIKATATSNLSATG